MLENYVKEMRGGDRILGAAGRRPLRTCGDRGRIRFGRRLEKYNIAWIEDTAPWQYTDHYRRLAESCCVPVCTGEDIYLAENFEPLLSARAIAVAHPDVLTIGGAAEMKKLSALCEKYGVALAVHMAESPVGFMAAVHVAAAMKNVLAVEFHSADCPAWASLVKGLPDPLIRDGFVTVPDAPGLGIESLNEAAIRECAHADYPSRGRYVGLGQRVVERPPVVVGSGFM